MLYDKNRGNEKHRKGGESGWVLRMGKENENTKERIEGVTTLESQGRRSLSPSAT